MNVLSSCIKPFVGWSTCNEIDGNAARLAGRKRTNRHCHICFIFFLRNCLLSRMPGSWKYAIITS